MKENQEIQHNEGHFVASTLAQLLDKMTAIDDGLLEIDLSDQIELMQEGKVKVDSYKYLVDKLEFQADLYKKWASEYLQAEKILRNKRKQILNHLLFSLQKSGFKKFTGNKYVVTIRKARPSVDIKSPASALMKVHYPDLVRSEYSWDKNEISNRLKSGDEKASEIASLKESYFAHFTLSKEVH